MLGVNYIGSSSGSVQFPPAGWSLALSELRLNLREVRDAGLRRLGWGAPARGWRGHDGRGRPRARGCAAESARCEDALRRVVPALWRLLGARAQHLPSRPSGSAASGRRGHAAGRRPTLPLRQWRVLAPDLRGDLRGDRAAPRATDAAHGGRADHRRPDARGRRRSETPAGAWGTDESVDVATPDSSSTSPRDADPAGTRRRRLGHPARTHLRHRPRRPGAPSTRSPSRGA